MMPSGFRVRFGKKPKKDAVEPVTAAVSDVVELVTLGRRMYPKQEEVRRWLAPQLADDARDAGLTPIQAKGGLETRVAGVQGDPETGGVFAALEAMSDRYGRMAFGWFYAVPFRLAAKGEQAWDSPITFRVHAALQGERDIEGALQLLSRLHLKPR